MINSWVKANNRVAIIQNKGKPLLIFTGHYDILRYVVGTWETGVGWKDYAGRTIHDPLLFTPIEVPTAKEILEW